MKKERRCAGARQGCRDLSADQPGLSRSGHNHFTPATVEQINGSDEVVVKPADYRCNAPGFDFEDGLRPPQKNGFIHGVELSFLNFVEPFNDPEELLELPERQ